MPKLSLSDITSGYNSSQRINAAFSALETALDNTVSRDGSAPNAMGASLDMNSNRILNVGSPQSSTDAARWVDVTGALAVSTALPSQVGNSGKYVTTDGTTLSFSEAYAKWQQTSREITAAVTPSSYFYAPRPWIDIRRYGAVGDGTTNNATAISQAISVAAAAGGTVFIPEGDFKYTSTLNLSAKVNVVGLGYGSKLIPTGCDAFTFNFYTTFGKCVFSNFAIAGSSTTTNVGFKQTGSLNDAQELYGLTFDKILMTGFNKSMSFRQTRVVTVNNCWFQDTNQAIDLTGKNFVWNITGNEFVYAAGSGAGTKVGINLQLFNFTSGSGNIGPEGIQIQRNQIFGFDYAMKLGYSFFTNVESNDIQALVRGIEFETNQYVLNIKNNYVEMSGASATQGIIGLGLSSAISTQVNIEGNAIDGTSLSTCSGIQINESGNTNQYYVSIVRNRIKSMPTYDIIVYNGGHTNIEDNRCESTAPTYNIRVDSVQAGVVHIDKNKCIKNIYFDPAEAASGEVRVGTNYINGSTISIGPQTVPSVASAATLVLPIGVNIFKITGSTTITSITATGWAGREVTLISSGGTWTLQDGGNLKLASNFVATSDDAIRLVCDGTDWYAAGGPSAN